LVEPVSGLYLFSPWFSSVLGGCSAAAWRMPTRSDPPASFAAIAKIIVASLSRTLHSVRCRQEAVGVSLNWYLRRDHAVLGLASLGTPAAVRDVVEDGPIEGSAVGAGLGAGEDALQCGHFVASRHDLPDYCKAWDSGIPVPRFIKLA
jgi:hypothetical protein